MHTSDSSKADSQAELHAKFIRCSVQAIANSKKAIRFLPNRRVRHLPSFETLIRPIEISRAATYAISMQKQGFREDEPVTVSDIIPSVNHQGTKVAIPMSIIGGNHRCCASRMAGLVVVRAYVVSYESLKRLYDILTLLDNLEERTCSEYERWQRVLRKLTVPCQVREPAPHATLVLEQVSMIRTYCEHTFRPSFDVNRNIYFGNADKLRRRMFNADKDQNISMDDSSHTHFLLNRRHSNRHANKLVRGSGLLIFTNVKIMNDEGDKCILNKSALDALLDWERSRIIGKFRETYLSNISEMSQSAVVEHIQDCHKALSNPGRRNDNLCPFASHVKKRFALGRRTHSVQTSVKQTNVKDRDMSIGQRENPRRSEESVHSNRARLVSTIDNSVDEERRKRQKIEVELSDARRKLRELQKLQIFEQKVKELESENVTLREKLRVVEAGTSQQQRSRRVALPTSLQLDQVELHSLRKLQDRVAQCIRRKQQKDNV